LKINLILLSSILCEEYHQKIVQLKIEINEDKGMLTLYIIFFGCINICIQNKFIFFFPQGTNFNTEFVFSFGAWNCNNSIEFWEWNSFLHINEYTFLTTMKYIENTNFERYKDRIIQAVLDSL
jgi:hypothetical protein